MSMQAGSRRVLVGGGWGVAAWLVFLVGGAWAWEAPADWDEIGTVRQWQAADAEFYRIQADALFFDESSFSIDQQKEYAKTRLYRGQVAGIGLEAWRELDSPGQAERRAQARRSLDYVVNFRNRILQQVQNARNNMSSNWGVLIGDRTVVGDVLSRLYTAVNLDPSNPYAWHLYSYFASLVGDAGRSWQALEAADLALAEIPAEALPELRAAVALDKAWQLRDRGEFVAAQNSLLVVAANGGNSLEARLLQGLLAAQTGDDVAAITIANGLRGTPVSAFPPNVRESGFRPELADVSTWRKRPSSYLSAWILAYTWLREGRVDMARSVFGGYSFDTQRPFANRFWNEAGLIYELTGRGRLARQAWSQARVTLPYYPYAVHKGYTMKLGRLTGRGGGIPYLLGFDSHFLGGSRLAYGAGLVADLAAATDPLEKQKLAARALDQLEICRRFGLNAGQASVLRGQVYYLMSDLTSARIEIDEALVTLDAVGDKAGFRAVMSGLNRTGDQRGARDLANFYGQSGVSQSRWRADADPAATLAALQKAYDTNPGDESRRDLARWLIRNGQVPTGRELAAAPLAGAALTAENVGGLNAPDLALLLEADRAAGQTDLALAMVAALGPDGVDPWQVADVWALAGFICLDNGLRAESRVALERAASLDPGNHGLKVQLSLM